MSLNGKVSAANERMGAGTKLRQSLTAMLSGTAWSKPRHLGLFAALPLALFGFGGTVSAQEWNGAESSDWFNRFNWNGADVPDGSEDVFVYTLGTNDAVISGQDATGLTLSVGDGFSPFGPGHGELTIENGGTYTGGIDIYIDGAVSGQASVVTVTGVDTASVTDQRSTMVAPNALDVGYYNEAYLYVYDGAYVEAGTAGVGGGILIGGPEDGLAFVTVSGVNADGSAVYRSELISNASLTMADTALPGSSTAGNSAGNLSILDGGYVSVAEELTVGYGVGGSGSVLVSGVNSDSGTDYRSELAVAGEAYVGFRGIATVTLADGGLMSVNGGSVYLADGDTSDAALNIGAASGETAVAPGELLADAIEFGEGIGTLVFNHTDDSGTYEFSPDIGALGFGSYSIVHEAGFTVLTGDLSSYDGGISVAGGILGGTFVSDASLSVLAGGAVAPGQSIGTQTYFDVTFETGSTYLVEVDDTGASDLILAPEGATLNGGVVDVSGVPLFDYDYVILTTTDGDVLGEFDGLTGISDSAFIDGVLSYDANNVYVTFTQIISLCGTDVRSAVCAAVETLPDTNVVLTSLLSLPTVEETADAFASLSGEIHPSTLGVLLEDGQQRVSAVNERVQGLLPNDIEDDRGLWATGYGQWLTRQHTGETAHLDANLGGFVFGVDREWNDGLLFGLMGGYSKSDIEQAELASDAVADTYSAGAYGGYERGPTVLSFGGVYNFHAIDTERGVSFAGFSDVLTASYNAHSWQAFAEVGHTIDLGMASLQPFAGVSYMGLYAESFTEAGGDAALTASDSTHHLGFTTLGMRTSADLTPKVKATAMGGWRYAFGDTDPETVFTLSSSDPFTVAGAPIDRHAFVTEFGLDAAVTDAASLNVSYAGQFGEDSVGHGFTLGFKKQF